MRDLAAMGERECQDGVSGVRWRHSRRTRAVAELITDLHMSIVVTNLGSAAVKVTISAEAMPTAIMRSICDGVVGKRWLVDGGQSFRVMVEA